MGRGDFAGVHWKLVVTSHPRSVPSGWHRAFVVPLLAATVVFGAAAERRARAPTWKQVPAGVFFDDAFQQGLTGEPRRPSAEAPAAPQDPAAASAQGMAWAESISAAAIEDELKASLGRLDGLLAQAGDFKARGYRAARREFALAAMLFAVIREYPAEVRWKNHAAAARDAFGQAALRTQVGSDAVLQQAQHLQQSLQELVRGGGFPEAAGDTPSDWPQICPRAPLMQRLEMAQIERLSPALGATAPFQKSTSLVLHEAQVVAAIAQALLQSGMEDAADEDYGDYCRAMKQAAQEIQRAAEQGDYESARGAASQLQQSCTDCHAAYRA